MPTTSSAAVEAADSAEELVATPAPTPPLRAVDAAPLAAPASSPRRRALFRIARVALLSAAARGPGFLIPLIAAAAFGAGPATDAYFLAYGAVLLAASAIGTALEATTVPAAARALLGSDAELALFRRMLRRRGLAFGMASAAGGGLVLYSCVRIFPPVHVPPSLVLRQYALLAPMALFSALSGSYSGVLLGAGRLETSIGSSFLRGIGALCGALIAARVHALWPLAIGLVLGESWRTMFLYSRFRHAVATRVRAANDAQPPREAAATPRRAALNQSSAQLLLAGAVLIERFIIGGAVGGAVSHIEYSWRLFFVASVLFDGGIGPFLLVKWSQARAAGRLRVDWPTVQRPIAGAAALAALVGLTLFVLAPFIIHLLYGHGAFRPADIAAVTGLLRAYAFGFVCNMTSICIERLLVARGQNARFLRLTVVRVGIRLTAVTLLLPGFGALAAPYGFALGELLYMLMMLPTTLSRGTR